MSECLMKKMTWKEYEAKKDKVLILPIGSTEQHGPHLPLSVDTVIAEEIALKFAQKIDGIVAPALSYGYKSKPLSGGGPLFPGTIDINGITVMKLVEDLLEEYIKDEITKIFILNAHFENEAFILESVDLVSQRHPEVTIIESNWWDVLSQETIDFCFDEIPFPGWAFEHAAITETSLMMYLAPELVREDKISNEMGATPAPYAKYPIIKGMVPDSGVLAPAISSNAQKGKRMTDEAIEAFIQIVKENM